MRRVAGGDDVAFAVLHSAHYARVVRLALAIVLDSEEARDVTQEVFLRLHGIAPRWKPDARVSTWLHRTTVNVASSARRRVTRWLRRSTGTRRADPDVESLLAAGELQALLEHELRALSPRQRAVTSLHLDAGLSPGEIAEQLGISAGAARVYLHKGLRRLRGAYRDELSPLNTEPVGRS